MTTPKPDHPLRISDVLGRSSRRTNVVLTDDLIWLNCRVCDRRQSLAQATLEAAEDPTDISVYRCMNGCELIAGTGYPSPIPPSPTTNRYPFNDFVIWYNTTLEIRVPPASPST